MDDLESTAVVETAEIEQPAAEVEEVSEQIEQPAAPEPESDTVTKVVSKRLKEYAEENARIKAENEYWRQQNETMAQARGFASFDELRTADIEERLASARESGDKAKVRAIMKEIADNDPEKVQLRQRVQSVEQEHAKSWMDEQVKAIGALDPDVKSFDDIAKLDTFEAFDRLARVPGVSMVDAYKSVNFDRLSRKKADAVQKQAAANASSKKHLPNTKASAIPSDVIIPEDVYKSYKSAGATDAQAKAHWAQYLKDNS